MVRLIMMSVNNVPGVLQKSVQITFREKYKINCLFKLTCFTLRNATSLLQHLTEFNSCGPPTYHTFLKFLTTDPGALFTQNRPWSPEMITRPIAQFSHSRWTIVYQGWTLLVMVYSTEQHLKWWNILLRVLIQFICNNNWKKSKIKKKT